MAQVVGDAPGHDHVEVFDPERPNAIYRHLGQLLTRDCTTSQAKQRSVL